MRRKSRERAELETGMMAGPVEPHRITPMDIQQKEFRNAFRGYSEREVDEFLDALTEELARWQSENVRLRAELENREQEARAAQAEAEVTLRRAREEAARMLQAAEAQAESVREVTEGAPALAEDAPSVGSFLKKNSMVQAIRPFLGREREFLQSMARLIQEHADSVREEVRQIREEPGSEGQEGAGPQVEADRTALPGETAPRSAGPHSNTTAEPEIPRRSGKRSAEREANPSEASRERAKAPDRRGRARDAQDDRRAKGRQGQGPASSAAPLTGAERRAGDALWGSPSTEGTPAELFQPKRRMARPPVSPLEEEDQPGGRPYDEGLSRKDLPPTQPFEPFRFDEHAADQPLERADGDEDERSLRELFWGEE